MSEADTADGEGMDGLDWKSQEILQRLYENGGSANTTDLRALTGIDNNAIIVYRHTEKLAPRGLVELEQPETDGTHIAPKVATLTSEGETVAERIIKGRGEASTNISEYVDQLEAKVNQLETRIDELETAENHRERDEQVAETVDEITSSKYGAWNIGGTEEFTELLFGMLALRNYLLEESSLTRDELDEKKAEAQAEFEDGN
jgi:TolA-binding protein